jgi:hypothetical protein
LDQAGALSLTKTSTSRAAAMKARLAFIAGLSPASAS